MADTKIEWAEKTWNPVTGCTPISEGCQNCYAKRMAKRLAGRCGYPKDDPFQPVLHSAEVIKQPQKWKKPCKIFVCSMSDIFHESLPFWMIDEVIDSCMIADWHIYMFLTKRPQQAYKYFNSTSNRMENFQKLNAMLGVTAENQARADERIPILLQIPAAVRFVSLEPMLSKISLARYLKWPLCKHWNANGNPDEYGKYRWEKQALVAAGWTGIDWVICGGESGPGARPMHPDWARNLRDQCRAAGVPFFLKQMHVDGKLIKMPELDGRRWGEMPNANTRS